MNIVIIEGGHHFEVVRSYALMFLHNDHKVTVLTNKMSYANLIQVLNDSVSWYIDEKNNFIDFLTDKIDMINQQDLVICTSPQAVGQSFITKKWKTKSYLVVHDIHNDFEVWNYLSIRNDQSLSSMLKTVKYFITGYFWKRKSARKTFDGILFPSAKMRHYASEKYGVQDSMVLPFLWNEKRSPIHERDYVKITIPGTIKQRSRDYEYCILMFEALKSRIQFDIQLVLLGQVVDAEAKEIIKKFLKLENEHLRIIKYEDLIDQKTFDEELLDADILLLPLQSRWQFGVVDEIGGLTCLSGNIGDMVRFAVPSLLPEHYNLSSELEPLALRFTMKDLDKDVEIITNIILQKSFNKVKENAEKFVKSINTNFP